MNLPLEPLPKFDRSISCLCWAYNEKILIEKFLLRLNQLLSENVEDYEIVIVDDASTDGTREIIREMQKKIPQIRLIENPVNINACLSFQKAYQSASKEFLFWQTIDWSYDLTHFRIFLELLKTHDVVAGVRREPTDKASLLRQFRSFFKVLGPEHLKVRSDNLAKAIVSVCNYYLVRFLFGFPLSDYQNIVFYPTHLIQSFRLESKSSFGNPEFLLKAHWKGASIAEAPIPFIPRTAGKAKGVSFKTVTASIKDIFSLWFKWMILGQKEENRAGAIERLNRAEWEKIPLAGRPQPI